MIRFVFVVIVWFMPALSWAGDLEVDLNGFRLQQFLSAVDPALGSPFKTIDEGDQVSNAYAIDQEAYMVVSHLKKYPHNISVLQITGVTKKALSFKGLRLGDPGSKVVEVLGKPDDVMQIESPRLTKLSYEGRNYTVELDEQDRLYSIQVFTTSDLMNKTDGSESEWTDFKAAILSKNTAALIDMMKPDVEIYRRGKILSIAEPYSAFVAKPDAEFTSALVGPTDSVLQQILQGEPVKELRLTRNVGVGVVYKFPEGKILKEIAFFPFNGTYRVYEVAFREGVK